MARGAGKDKGAPPALTVIEGGETKGVTETAVARALTTEEFKEALYRKLMARHRAVDAKLAEIDSGRKAIAKQRTEIRNQLTQAGYLLGNVDNVLKDSGKTREPRPKQQEKVDQLHWMREMEGLPNAVTGEQLDLMSRLPETERDGVNWDNEGFNSGLIDEPCEIPAACPPIFHQRWTDHWHKGQERRKWAEAQDVEKTRALAEAEPASSDEAPCDGCGGDGSKLDDGVDVCPDCGEEYEPEPGPIDGEEKPADEDDSLIGGEPAAAVH